MSEQEASNPISSETSFIIEEIVNTNTSIYRKIFKCVPDNLVSTFSEV